MLILRALGVLGVLEIEGKQSARENADCCLFTHSH